MTVIKTGEQFDGQWLNDKREGTCTYTNSRGETRMGLWENDQRVKWLQADFQY